MTEGELRDSKLYKKAKKLMGTDNIMEFFKKGDQELKDLIALNSVHIQEVSAQMKENSAYRTACATKGDFEKGLRESLAPNKVANELASVLLSIRKNQP
jgi:hypothetical protein